MTKYIDDIKKELAKEGISKKEAASVIGAIERGKPNKKADPKFKRELLTLLEERAGQMRGERGMRATFIRSHRTIFGLGTAVLAVFLIMVVTSYEAGDNGVPGETLEDAASDSFQVESVEVKSSRSTFMAPAAAPVAPKGIMPEAAIGGVLKEECDENATSTLSEDGTDPCKSKEPE